MSSKLRTTLSLIIPLAIVAYYVYPVVKELLNSDDKHEVCQRGLEEPDEAIKACSALISSGLEPESQAAAYNNRGLAHQKKGSFAAAISDFNAALALNPLADIYRNRADTHNMRKSFGMALADYTKALALEPQNGALLNNFAWFLATCPSARHRNGKRAVALATKALALRESIGRLDTLGAALAEAGRFKQAIETQQKIIAINDNEETRARLALYKKGKAYRMPR